MTEQQMLTILKNNLDRARDSKWVYKPMSWALYQTWKEVDEKERVRKT